MSVQIDGYELPAHVSYSSLTTWLDCGWLYILTRVHKVSEKPAHWFLGGSAVHEATETLDRQLFEGEGEGK